ncbi:ABC transporter substrate-binding protein [Rheinheimera sp.]|uniref:substrate-binding periplasmic protein n=1 Tax=Rheinheimera sp. TaxID=1869214 RepID=UPI00273442F2|nr:transporter substrate-binding domain-containing protein [Rheinheimera sp.]MDP2715997.1 transporter substrate-binding domain-containing protein [Rheinheimera sp.]
MKSEYRFFSIRYKWLLGLFFSGYCLAQQPLHLLTEHNPPGEYLNAQGEITGVTAELIRVLQQRLDEPGTMQLMPWGRALNIARTAENTALFETVRTAEREHWFKWVGPLKHYQISLYGLKERVGERPDLNALAANYTACSYRNSATVDELKQRGFIEGKTLVLTSKSGDCLNMLLLGRVDLTAVSELSLPEFIASVQQAGHELILVQYLSGRKRYLAFSRDIADERIARWQQALEQSYRDGTMRKLYQPVYAEAIIQRLEDFAVQPKY